MAAQFFCSYIYGAFVVVDSALQVGMQLAQSMLNMINAFFDAVLDLFKYVIDVMVSSILDEFRILWKKLVDWIISKIDPNGNVAKTFCTNLYKCNIFIQELTDENSLIASSLIKWGMLSREQIQFANSIISDYNQFKDTVCTYGFTYNFGLSYLKRALMLWKGILEGFLDKISAKKEDIRRLIQSYINKLYDSGIMDLMAKLRKFFNCVLEQTGICADIASSKLAYNNWLAFAHIQENGAGCYMLDPKESAKMLNACDSRLNAIKNAKTDLDKALEEIIKPADVAAASKAFNIASNIFPGGMTWTAFKEGRWKENKMIKYFCVKGTQFGQAFLGMHDEELPPGISTNYILAGMTINDEKGIISIDLPNGYKEVIDMNDRASFRKYNTDNGVNLIDEIYEENPIEYYVDANVTDDTEFGAMLTPDGRIISIRRAAFEISQDPESELAKRCEEVYKMLKNGFIRADEVVEQW